MGDALIAGSEWKQTKSRRTFPAFCCRVSCLRRAGGGETTTKKTHSQFQGITPTSHLPPKAFFCRSVAACCAPFCSPGYNRSAIQPFISHIQPHVLKTKFQHAPILWISLRQCCGDHSITVIQSLITPFLLFKKSSFITIVDYFLL